MRMLDGEDFEKYLYEEALFDDLSDLFVMYRLAAVNRKCIIYEMIAKAMEDIKRNRLSLDQQDQVDAWKKEADKIRKKCG
jgi:hypothetical protein